MDIAASGSADMSGPLTRAHPPSAGDPQIAEVQRMLRHPRFAEAAQLHVRLILETCEANQPARSILGNTARHVAFSIISSLSAAAEVRPGMSPPAQSHVVARIEAMGLSSHGKVEALIKRMMDQGLVTRTVSGRDRRARPVCPTEVFREVDDRLCAAHARPCTLLLDEEPSAGTDAATAAMIAGISAGDRSATRRMRAAALPMVENGAAMLARNPQMIHFLAFDAGVLVLFALRDALWRGDRRAPKFDAIARLCGVSRPHVRNILMHAHAEGVLEYISHGVLQPTAAFGRDADRWIAECLAAFLGCCRLALAQDPPQ